VIRCEHCGSALPDGAIFCGECGRAVTTSAARRTAPVEPVDRATPPPLQQPDAHGRAPEDAGDGWLPESTLDPATRAWLTGTDRARQAPRPDGASGAAAGTDPSTQPSASRPDLTPRSAPTHVHGAGSGLGDWTGRPAESAESVADVPSEPTLDPDAFPSETVAPQDDPEVHRAAAWAPTDAPAGSGAPVWEPQATPPAPAAGPSWWIGRTPSAAATDAADPAGADASEDLTGSDAPNAPDVSEDDGPRPGDTAAFQPVFERRAPRPAPLVAPGSQSTTCHVCGHALEPDDIFCEECGSVRPAVTAAFTGPVMPLPLTRPDWAADEQALRSAVSDAHELTDERDTTPADGLAAEDEVAEVDTPHTADVRGDALGTPAASTVDVDVIDDVASDDVTAPEESDDREDSHDAEHADHTAGADDTAGDHDPEADPQSSGSSADPDTEARPPSAAPLPPVAGAPGSAPESEAPKAAPLPPVGRAADPALTSADTTEDEDEDEDGDEDVEATRIVSRTAEQAPFLLHFSTGERLGVRGSALLGRLPRPEDGERFDDLLTIRDPGKSVSKTHLELGRDGDDLWVSDRHSGNGTVIRHIDGSIRRCEPGHRYRVERGARVDIGEQFFLLQ
jgi:predicted nucleic acid-binding Zn ribbon protein